jgi:hypothetical protein
MQFQQTVTGTKTTIGLLDRDLYCLQYVNPSAFVPIVFWNQADAQAYLASGKCPPGTSVQTCRIGCSPPGYIKIGTLYYPFPQFGGTGPLYGVLQRLSNAMIAIFAWKPEAVAWATRNQAAKIACFEADGNFVY